MAETENIYQKLSKIRKQVEVMQKNTKAYSYNYVSEEDLLAKITAMKDRLHLSLIPSILPNSTKVLPCNFAKTKIKDGQIYEENVHEIIVNADMTWTWINDDNPEERVIVPWITVGQQSDAAQALGSGLTYTFRYFLLKFFNVATPKDDPDNWRNKQREAEIAEDKLLAEKTIQEFDGILKKFLAENSDKTDEVKKFLSKYVKGSNYFAITESALAAKLLSDFKKTYIKGE